MIEALGPQAIILGKVVLAGLLGGVIGIEREYRRKPAGLKTQMIVSAASALLLILGMDLITYYQANNAEAVVQADPTRILHAIVVGISFLGAGTIITHQKAGQVEGLTTAATILLSAGIGIAVALDQYLLAIGVSLITLTVLATIRGFEGVIHDAQDDEKTDTKRPRKNENP